ELRTVGSLSLIRTDKTCVQRNWIRIFRLFDCCGNQISWRVLGLVSCVLNRYENRTAAAFHCSFEL
ncbi:hypothetical protein TIFTF001_056367, partial [Ficus carica]